jgi:hypothetical protein
LYYYQSSALMDVAQQNPIVKTCKPKTPNHSTTKDAPLLAPIGASILSLPNIIYFWLLRSSQWQILWKAGTRMAKNAQAYSFKKKLRTIKRQARSFCQTLFSIAYSLLIKLPYKSLNW